MPAPITTSLRTILPAITAQITSGTGVPANRVLLLARETTPRFQGDSDILVRVGRALPDEGMASGAGRNGVLLYRVLQVTPRVRRSTDLSDRDDLALLDESAGLLALEEQLIDALHIWVPRSGDNWLAQEPIHWEPGAVPLHETPISDAWLHSDLVFLLRYQLSVKATTF